MVVIVAERQGSDREAVAERSRRQNADRRNTNWQRGRRWATSVRVNAKSEDHQDIFGRARRRGVKVEGLTRGGLLRESAGEVSRGRSSEEARRKAGRAKGRSIKESGSTESCAIRRETPGTRGAATAAASVDRHEAREPVKPGEIAAGGVESGWMSGGERKP